MGKVPDGVWMEMAGALNELEFSFNQLETDGYKVGGYIPVDNYLLSDRGYLCGDEVREDMDRDPAGLTTYEKLENYIPVDRLGDQKKLKDKEGDGNASK